jgi:uncharacterized delta-60 repeat protein
VIEPLEPRALLSSAVLDASFGGSGTGFAPAPVSFVAARTMYPDGRILTLIDGGGSTREIQLIRHAADGTLDATYTPTFTATEHRSASTLAVQPDGKILVGGSVRTPTGFQLRLAVARYNVDGTPDLTFGVGGLVTELADDNESDCTAIVVQPDGRILVAGERKSSSWHADFAVYRYNADGSPDSSFGARNSSGRRIGRAQLDVFGSVDVVERMALQPNGSIVIAGSARAGNRPGGGGYAIVRFTPAGDLDRTFLGAVNKVFGTKDLLIAGDGSILVGVNDRLGVRLVQYDAATGQLRAEAALPSGRPLNLRDGIDLAITPEQTIVAIANDRENWMQARFGFTAGQVVANKSFGTGGWLVTDFGPNHMVPSGPGWGPGSYEAYDYASNVFAQPNGGIVIDGHAVQPSPNGTAGVFARFLDTGTLAGNVFADVAADGLRNAGDYMVGGFRVFLDRNGDGWWNRGEIFTRTDELGRYTLSDVPAGLYWLRVTHIGGWRFTTNDALRVRVTPGGDVIRHFGVTRNLLILGNVFLDADASGGRDEGELGLRGWTVFADADDDGVLDPDEVSARTDALGRYAIRTLAGGAHRIRVQQDPNYRRTAPAAGFRDVSLLPGAVVTRVNFGQERIA